eukprot:TRINITY_DN3701_c0_g2_i2.p1 TRINITY_DN3701_c0_g2~~TRINITY_DN3701_c0_g2_i2.p1  ORF type:complete len:419 (+),score=97.28 TRINITY_DN3701_c0_g2_i2:125-1381(+)
MNMRQAGRHFLEVEYLSDEALSGFQSYKYNSVDTSPLSNYVMHPFWNWTVKRFCPLWVAPNLLTLLGFLACVLHFLVLAAFDPDFTDPSRIPSSAWAASAILLFLSHTLDGIDGKQARRTQTSGPLGELFDHGLDSWSTMFITTSLYAVFGRDPSTSISPGRMYLALWAVFLNFQFSHFEKYNTGIMYLPWAYDVSMVGGTLLYLLTAALGPQFFSKQMTFPPGPFLEFTLYLGSVGLTVPAGLLNIYRSYRDGTGKNRPFLEAIRPLSSFASALSICLSWILLNPSILNDHPRVFYYTSGVLYSNIACRLIVAQMSNTRVELHNALLLPTGMALLCSCLTSPQYGGSIIFGLAGALTLAHVHYGVCVVRQLCRHFGILCFRIKSNQGSGNQDENEDDNQRLLSAAPSEDEFPSVEII